MAATAEAYGFGARAPYAQPRESECDMKQRVRLSGLFPRVCNQPMSNQLQALLKAFEQNAALTGILERRRRMEEKTQYELRSREAVAALNTNLAPPFRTGNASFATSAAVAQKVADEVKAPPPPTPLDALAAAQARYEEARKRRKDAKKAAEAVVPDAAAVMTGTIGVSSHGGSVSSNSPATPVLAVRSDSVPAQRAPRGRSNTPSNKNRRKK